MKRLLFFFMTAVLSLNAMWAQVKVSGKVTDEEGAPLSGVAVQGKNTLDGTYSDDAGAYSLELPTGTTTLVFTYYGKATKEVVLDGRSEINVTLIDEARTTDAVVVTALSLKENRDQSASSSTGINTNITARSGETGVLQGMAGKTSGILIQKNSGDPGAGGYIQIRGQSTITGNIQPLIVVDGMPINNSSISTEANTQGVVEQSRLNDINPDDIESMEVLKGAAAAAQWGTRAANGVIIITTKRGKAGMGKRPFTVSFRSTLSFDQVSMMHPLQSNYGQGSGNKWIANNPLSWGDKIASRSGNANTYVTGKEQYYYKSGSNFVDAYGGYFEAQDGTKHYATLKANTNVYDKNGTLLFKTPASGGNSSKDLYNNQNFDQVFRTGHFWDKSISISGGNLNSNYFLSFSDLDQKGIIRNNSDYRRSTVRFNVDHRFTDKLKFSSSASYALSGSNRIQQGSNTAGLFLGYLRTPVDFDNSDYIGTTYSASGVPTFNSHRAYRSSLGGTNPRYNNPGWTINEQKNRSDVNRFLLGSEIQYDPTSWLNITARGGVDHYTDLRKTYFPVYSAGYTTGYFIDYRITETQLNGDVFARAAYKLGKINGTALVGFNVNNRKYSDQFGSINTFIVATAPPTLSNSAAANRVTTNFNSEIRTAANYINLGWDVADKLFLTLTGRTETASTFGPNANKFFFYPSASAAYVFMQGNKDKTFSFGKLRASYGEVGVQPGPYLTTNDYVSASLVSGWGDGIDPSPFGTGSYVRSNVQGNPNLKPERKREFEVGTDLRFFKDKLTLGFTYYRNKTIGAIFAVDVPASTGFSSKWDNAATLSNRGIEFDWKVNALDNPKKELYWNIFGNVSRNRNNVDDLKGVQSIFLAGFEGTSSRAVVGQPLGAMWGASFQKNEDGSYVLDANGFPKATPSEGVIGNPNPKWRASAGSEIGFGGFGLSFLFETSQGQQMWNGTQGVLSYFGRSKNTDTETIITAADVSSIKNYAGKTIDKIDNDGDGLPDYTANTDGSYTVRGTISEFNSGKKVLLDQSWYTGLGGGFGPVSSQFIQDASWTRLREVTLSYRIASEKFRTASKLGPVDFSITGRNLLIWTKWQGIDPDTNLTGSSNGRGLEYFNNPGTRSLLFTVKVTY